jgi:predicted lipoprotein
LSKILFTPTSILANLYLIDVKSLYFDIKIYNFSASPDLIENNFLDKTTFDSGYTSNNSRVSIGLGGMEYLLYDDIGSKNSFTLLQEDTYRVDCLLAIREENLRQINLLINFCKQSYKTTFEGYKSSSCLENTHCLTFNQLINIIDIIRVTKIGKPAGLEKSPNINLDNLEAFRSRSSLEEVQNARTLSSVNFANIVDEISDSLEISIAIEQSFTTVFNNIDATDSDFNTAISNGNQSIQNLHTSILTLLKYFSVDVASALSLTVTFTDNDSD